MGKALRKAREDLCLPRAQVARVIGVSAETLKAYENGKRILPFDVFYKSIHFLSFRIGTLEISD